MVEPGPDRAVERIVIRGVNWLGDAVMTTPAVRRLREWRPDAHFTLFTPAKLADLWKHHPDVDAVIPCPATDGVWRAARRLKEGRFDLAVVFPNSPRSAIEGFLARIPRRVGFARPWRNWALTDAVPSHGFEVATRKRRVSEIRDLISDPDGKRESFSTSAHHIHHYLGLVARLGASSEPLAPMLTVTEREVREVLEKFGLESGERGVPLIAINPGAEFGPAKRWPWERFAELIRQVHRSARCRWVIVGGGADRELAARIDCAIHDKLAGEDSPGTGRQMLNLAGATTLRELCAVFRACRAVVTNDTGPMHVAAAVGAPVIGLFGSTSPELTGPGLAGEPRHRPLSGEAACAPCFRRECPIDFRCMLSIAPARVAEELLRVLASR